MSKKEVIDYAKSSDTSDAKAAVALTADAQYQYKRQQRMAHLSCDGASRSARAIHHSSHAMKSEDVIPHSSLSIWRLILVLS